jgi:hypothetical protein
MIIYIHIYAHIYSEREQNYISESVWGDYGEEYVREWKIIKHPTVYEYNTMHCAVNDWILGSMVIENE